MKSFTRIEIHDGFAPNVATTALEPLQLIKSHSLTVETVPFHVKIVNLEFSST